MQKRGENVCGKTQKTLSKGPESGWAFWPLKKIKCALHYNYEKGVCAYYRGFGYFPAVCPN